MTNPQQLIYALIATAKRGSKSVRKGANPWDQPLSDTEEQLLMAASPSGGIKVIAIGLPFPSIEAGELRVPADEDDEQLLPAFYKALYSLCERGVLKHISGPLFSFTVDGVLKARQLRRECDPEKGS